MGKRMLALVCFFSFLFTSLIGRCAYIAFTDTYQVSDSYNSYTINIGKLYPYIYDRRGEKLNNNKLTRVAVIKPDEKCLAELDKLFTEDKIKNITEELSKGYPLSMPVDKRAETKHILQLDRIEQNQENMLCRHLLDYQCGGLEGYTNKEIGELKVNFSVDAMGRILSGDSCEVISNDYDSTDGVVISIDKRIQEICEGSVGTMKKGAVVVMDTATSQLLASVSVGNDYNNRALSSYAIGSVFKVVVCACAIENGVNALYNCTSSITVGDSVFSCQKNHSHGMQNMKMALANSCNCYFVNLAVKLGADKLYKTAKSLGFGDAFSLYDNWSISSGNMPDTSTLSSLGQLALLGFGQGQLTDSPVHFAAVLSCIANGGNYSSPTIDITEVKDNKVLSDKTVKTLMEYMHFVVTSGTGTLANYNDKTAGKTATAQSGMFDNGREILNTWFAGVYPSDNPKYAIVVMCEDGTSGAGDCCPIFRTIVEKLNDM